MGSKDLFHEFDPFSPKRIVESSAPMMPTLTREDSKKLDESFLETFDTRQHTESQEKRDMRIVYGMIENLRKENAEIKEEMRQRDCSRQKEMHLLVEKISDLTSALVDRKPEVNRHPMENVSKHKEHGTLIDPEMTVMKEKADKKVSWDKKVKNNEEEGSQMYPCNPPLGVLRRN